MKKLFLVLFVLAVTASLYAQNDKPLNIGVEAGVSVNNFVNSGRDPRGGFYVGVRGEYNLENVYLSGGLRFIRKGADAFGGESDSDSFYEADYLELPLAVGVKSKLGRSSDFFVETGPYFSVGVGGKAKGENFSFGPGKTTRWDYGFFTKENGNPSRFDCGWGVRTGVRLGSFELSAGYELGFCKVLKDSYDPSFLEGHNSNFMLGLAYLF